MAAIIDELSTSTASLALNESNITLENVPEIFSPVKDIELAKERKESGNCFFRNSQFDDAIDMYSQAITCCPESEEFKDDLAAFHGNRAAAYFSSAEWELTIEDCTKAIELKPSYAKVLARRSQAFEKLEKPDEALADLKTMKEIEPGYPKLNENIARLEKACEERMTKMKDEALGKLKELGNSILGNFGMSLDSFKMAQDPKSGSWNISMNK